MHIWAPCADEHTVIEQGNLHNLPQWLYSIVHIHMAQQDAQFECPLQLFDALVYVQRLQQMIPAPQFATFSPASLHICESHRSQKMQSRHLHRCDRVTGRHCSPQAEEKCAVLCAHLMIGHNFGMLPAHIPDVLQKWIALLPLAKQVAHQIALGSICAKCPVKPSGRLLSCAAPEPFCITEDDARRSPHNNTSAPVYPKVFQVSVH